MGELIAPPIPGYMCSVFINSLPKIFVILAACAVIAYRTEMYFAPEIEITRDVPYQICWHHEDGGDYRGDRICNNAVGAGVTTIMISLMLLIIDMIIPCLSTSYTRLATLFTILWSVISAAYWLVTGALLADLYRRYCNKKDDDCNEDERRFTVLAIMSFVCAGGWGVVVFFALVRVCCGRSDSHDIKTYST